jgi:formylglycine-generating enzyme required for sulfatase activity
LQVVVAIFLAALVLPAPGRGQTRKTPADKEGKEEIVNSIGMKLVRIPAGTFMMGSPEDEGSEDERPQHKVKISKAFYMGVYTVTQAEYEKVMKTNPSHFCARGGGGGKVKGMHTSNFPVENVSWNDAVKFCEKLSALEEEKKAGRVYRPPTEAEWEYACRAGTKTEYHSGNDEADLKKVGWYSANSGKRPHEVGEKKQANARGLYDMHGNVWQWCADWYARDYYKEGDKTDPEGPKKGIYRVLRGGSWFLEARYCRAAYRIRADPYGRGNDFGVRVVCVAAGTR